MFFIIKITGLPGIQYQILLIHTKRVQFVAQAHSELQLMSRESLNFKT